MRGSPQFSFWILIALAKICLFHIVVLVGKFLKKPEYSEKRRTYAQIPCTPLARSWAKIASYKNVMECDVRSYGRRTRPRAILLAMTIKNYRHAS